MARRLPPRHKSGPLKGKFRKRKSRRKKSTRRRKSSRARRRRPMAKKKRRRRRKSRTTTSAIMNKLKVAGWTAAYAYAKEKSTIGPKMATIPYIETIGYDATMAIAAHLLAKHGPAITRKPMDALATGLCGVVGYRFGAAGFKITGIEGGVYGGELSGEIVPDEFADDDDDE